MPAIPASHHPDGTPRVLSDGRRLWHVTTLWAAARPDLPVVRVPLSSIRELDEVCWFDKAWGKPPTCRAVAEHCRRILTVDLAVPVILGPLDGNPIAVLDGMHRAVRALLEGHTDLPAVVLTSMPPPDEVLSPDDPRYDAG